MEIYFFIAQKIDGFCFLTSFYHLNLFFSTSGQLYMLNLTRHHVCCPKDSAQSNLSRSKCQNIICQNNYVYIIFFIETIILLRKFGFNFYANSLDSLFFLSEFFLLHDLDILRCFMLTDELKVMYYQNNRNSERKWFQRYLHITTIFFFNSNFKAIKRLFNQTMFLIYITVIVQ